VSEAKPTRCARLLHFLISSFPSSDAAAQPAAHTDGQHHLRAAQRRVRCGRRRVSRERQRRFSPPHAPQRGQKGAARRSEWQPPCSAVLRTPTAPARPGLAETAGWSKAVVVLQATGAADVRLAGSAAKIPGTTDGALTSRSAARLCAARCRKPRAQCCPRPRRVLGRARPGARGCVAAERRGALKSHRLSAHAPAQHIVAHGPTANTPAPSRLPGAAARARAATPSRQCRRRRAARARPSWTARQLAAPRARPATRLQGFDARRPPSCPCGASWPRPIHRVLASTPARGRRPASCGAQQAGCHGT